MKKKLLFLIVCSFVVAGVFTECGEKEADATHNKVESSSGRSDLSNNDTKNSDTPAVGQEETKDDVQIKLIKEAGYLSDGSVCRWYEYEYDEQGTK